MTSVSPNLCSFIQVFRVRREGASTGRSSGRHGDFYGLTERFRGGSRNVIEMVSDVGRDSSDKAGFSGQRNETAATGMSYGH